MINCKTGTFTANNAMINLNVVGNASGSGKLVAGSGATIPMPKIVTVKNVEGGASLDISGYVEGTVTVNVLSTNGTMGEGYEIGDSATVNKFAIEKVEQKATLKLPTVAVSTVTQFVVKYQRNVEAGVAIKNSADKFPSTIRLTLKALCVDPCSADTLRACYIVLPSFQVSPEVSLSLTTDAQLEYTGDLQVDYCSEDKCLYEIYIAEADEEE